VTELEHFFDPAAYHADALTTAAAAEIATLSVDLALVRLCLAFRDGARADAGAVLRHLEASDPLGRALFLVRTARIHHAAPALDRWLDDWQRFPANWSADVLEASGVKPLAAGLSPERLRAPVATMPALTKADCAFVKGLKSAIRAAVMENLEWLRTWEPTASPAAIAARYHLAAVNRDLNEATLSVAVGELPDLILACDENGKMLGSFIAH
jgi:hypothetical protein